MIASHDPTLRQKHYAMLVAKNKSPRKKYLAIFLELHKRMRIVYLSYFLVTIGIFFIPEQFLYQNYTFNNYTPAIYKILYSILENSIQKINDVENVQYIISSPFTVIVASIQLAMLLSFVINTPFILYQIYQFVAPGMYSHEKKILKQAMIMLVGMFFLGATLAYFIIVPITIQILTLLSVPLMNYGNQVPISVLFTLNSIFDIIVWTVFSAGFLYMVPGVIYILVLLEVVDVKYLVDNRKNVIVALLALAAVITPDPTMVSMLIISGPVIIIYEIIIHLGYQNKRKYKKNNFEWRLVQ